MKIFGSISRLVAVLFRKDSNDITVRPNQATTYTGASDMQLPPGDANHVLVSANSAQTLSNKTIDGDDNTLQDISIASLKTVLGDADEAILRDAAGAVVSAKIANVNIATGAAIDAAKIHDGSVSNTEFGYLDGVTSSIQTQFGTKVTGPASATGDAAVRFDSTTGKLVKNSSLIITDAGAVSGATQLDVDNLRLDGNTLSSTDTNGNVVLDPNGTGEIQASANLNVLAAATLKLSDADSSAFIGHKSPSVVAASVTYEWPEAPAANGYVLKSTTAGVMSWSASAVNSFNATWTMADGATKAITHNLGSKDIQVEIYDMTDDQTIWVDTVIRTSTNVLTLTASEAPGASSWRVVIHAV